MWYNTTQCRIAWDISQQIIAVYYVIIRDSLHGETLKQCNSITKQIETGLITFNKSGSGTTYLL